MNNFRLSITNQQTFHIGCGFSARNRVGKIEISDGSKVFYQRHHAVMKQSEMEPYQGRNATQWNEQLYEKKVSPPASSYHPSMPASQLTTSVQVDMMWIATSNVLAMAAQSASSHSDQ
jgi:hypothetical protein